MPRIGGGHDFCSRRKGLVPPQSPAAPAPPVGEPCGFAPGCACGAFDAFGHHDDIYFLISFLGRGSDHHGWRQLLGFVSWENVGKTKGLFCGIIGASEKGPAVPLPCRRFRILDSAQEKPEDQKIFGLCYFLWISASFWALVSCLMAYSRRRASE